MTAIQSSHFVFNGFIRKGNIRSSEIPREQLLNAIQPTVYMLSCPQAFWAALLENVSFWIGAKKENRKYYPVPYICKTYPKFIS